MGFLSVMSPYHVFFSKSCSHLLKPHPKGTKQNESNTSHIKLKFKGAFFHLKYVVIFGLPAIFALIDGMEPPDGPICISRVSLYSKIWRGFDRGLYAFFKVNRRF